MQYFINNGCSVCLMCWVGLASIYSLHLIITPINSPQDIMTVSTDPFSAPAVFPSISIPLKLEAFFCSAAALFSGFFLSTLVIYVDPISRYKLWPGIPSFLKDQVSSATQKVVLTFSWQKLDGNTSFPSLFLCSLFVSEYSDLFSQMKR